MNCATQVSLLSACGQGQATYVEINVEVSRATKFTVANLECDSHLVVLVQFLVETFSGMRFEDNVVGEDTGQEGESCHEG